MTSDTTEIFIPQTDTEARVYQEGQALRVQGGVAGQVFSQYDSWGGTAFDVAHHEQTDVIAPVEFSDAEAELADAIIAGRAAMRRLFEPDPGLPAAHVTEEAPEPRGDGVVTEEGGLALADHIPASTDIEGSAAAVVADEVVPKLAEPTEPKAVVETSTTTAATPTVENDSIVAEESTVAPATTSTNGATVHSDGEAEDLWDTRFLDAYQAAHSASVQSKMDDLAKAADTIDSELAAAADRMTAKTDAILDEAEEQARQLYLESLEERGRAINDRYIRGIIPPKFDIKTIEELGDAGLQALMVQLAAVLNEASSLETLEVEKILGRAFAKILHPDHNTPKGQAVMSLIEEMRSSKAGGILAFGRAVLPLVAQEITADPGKPDAQA